METERRSNGGDTTIPRKPIRKNSKGEKKVILMEEEATR